MEVIIHPIVISVDRNENPLRFFVERNNNKWKKMLDELKDSFKDYEKTYGLKVEKVSRLYDDFVEIKFNFSDQTKYLEYGDMDDIGETLVSFINWDLSHGDYPSFYQNNMERGKKIESFTTVER